MVHRRACFEYLINPSFPSSTDGGSLSATHGEKLPIPAGSLPAISTVQCAWIIESSGKTLWGQPAVENAQVWGGETWVRSRLPHLLTMWLCVCHSPFQALVLPSRPPYFYELETVLWGCLQEAAGKVACVAKWFFWGKDLLCRGREAGCPWVSLCDLNSASAYRVESRLHPLITSPSSFLN